MLVTPGITSIVGFGRTPAPVPDGEIDAVRRAVTSGHRLEPWPYLRVGESVRIEQGCLQGLRGALVREKDRLRVVVNVELLQRSVAVEIDRQALSCDDHPVRPVRPRLSLPTAS